MREDNVRCPTLDELAPPPRGRIGWPWTEESLRLSEHLPDGQPWPRISIVTPSFNQGQFIEETIRSVLLQGYPDLEYVVVDGGSADGTIDIIRKYEPWLTYWVSEPDRGQSQALNKGFARVTGDVLNWLNSDDTYLPGAIARVAHAYQSAPGCAVAGSVLNVTDATGQPEHVERIIQANLSLETLVKFWEQRFSFHQPGFFFPGWVWRKVGGLDESLDYTMDYDFLCRALPLISVTYLDDLLVRFRLHSESKTVSRHLAMFTERMKVSQRYWQRVPGIEADAFFTYSVDHLVRYAGTEVLGGRYRDALAYIKASLAVDPRVTLRTLSAQALGGLRRHLLAAR
jgi:glycosyltransferase involved in cell wall biosynthesis